MSLKKSLENDGYKLIDTFFSREEADKIRSELEVAFLSEKVIKVDDDGIRVSTLNGDSLISMSGSSFRLYNRVLDFLRSSFECVYELEDKRIGISANLLSGDNDKFRMHFDRNQITVVLYVTYNSEFPLILYPFMREDPRLFSGGSPPLLRPVDEAEAIKVYPKPGLATIFLGRRTLHGISYEEGLSGRGGPRYSLQFAFDLKETDYSGEKYYGK